MIIANARVVTPTGTIEGFVQTEGDKIRAVGAGAPPEGDETIDAAGRYVIPGVVDPETHLGTWSPVGPEAHTESRAALANGVTTWGFQSAGPMLALEPQSPWEGEPPLFSEMIPDWLGAMQENCMTDYFLIPIVNTEEQVNEIPEIAAEWGLTAFKLYLHMKQAGRIAGRWTPLREGEDQTSGVVSKQWAPLGQMGFVEFDDGVVFRTLEEAAKIPNGIVSMHCENWEIVRLLEQREKERASDIAAWNRRSPGFVEAAHVNQYAYYAQHLGCRFYVQHITSPETMEIVNLWKERGLDIQGQCGACYLTLPEETFKLNPPLRSRETMEQLWRYVAEGDISCTGSDHVAFYATREELDAGNVWESRSGFPSRVEALLPSLLTEGVSKGRISIERLVEIASTNPAKAFGLYPRKGVLAAGADADIVIVDPERRVRCTRDNVLSGVGWSAYEGWEYVGFPVLTIAGGAVVAEWPEDADSPVIDETRRGRYVRR